MKKLFFKNGLHAVTYDGVVYWRLRYSWQGRDRVISLGVAGGSRTFDAVPFEDAYQRALDALSLINEGIDPSEYRATHFKTRHYMGFRRLDESREWSQIVSRDDSEFLEELSKWLKR